MVGMKTKKWKSGATFGDEFEKEVFTMLDKASISYRKEETLSSGKRRKKDKKCDIECLMDDKSIFIELKTLTDKEALKFDLYNHGLNCNLKYHQIKAMDYLVIKFRPHSKIKEAEMYKVSKVDFFMWAITVKKKSASLKDFRKIGTLITDMGWLL